MSYPIIAPGYFITPKRLLHSSSYSLNNVATGNPTTLSRTLPTFSIDSGLVFERETSFLGRQATQTLEPRLFYVYTPYKDQSQFPLFDTALAEFNFAQIFSENRFVGNDRISDANQLTAAVVSRFIEEDGAERLRMAVGQRFYFNQQRVTNEQAIASAGAVNAGGSASENKSDLLAAVSGQLTQALARGRRRTVQPEHREDQCVQLRRALAARAAACAEPAVPQGRADRVDLVDLSGQWPLPTACMASGG